MQAAQTRIGILSTAEIAHKVCSAIQSSENCVAYAVASRSLEKAEAWAKAHNIQVFYGTYDELLNDPNVDAVYIPLPTSLKREWTIKAANAKKHVLVEKPLPGADSTKDVEEMIAACKDNNVSFLDGTMWLHSLRTQELLKKKSEIGTIRIVNTAFTFLGPNEEWIQGGNGRTNKNQEPQGCLGDQGWYPIAAILLAYNYELPLRVRTLNCIKNKVDTIIQTHGFLEFSDNRVAQFDIGVTSPHRSFVEIIGDKGVIRIDDLVGGFGRTGNFQAYFESFVGSDRFFIDDVQGKEAIVQTQASDHTKLMVEQFGRLAQAGVFDESWSKRSLNTHTVLAALFRSAENNGEVITL